jgi:small neutral amino acid transporter SnatA (MarC family)
MHFIFHIQSISFYLQKLEATPFTSRAVIGIAIGAGSLAGGILLFCVIWRLLRSSKDKEDKFEQQPNRINSVMPAIPPSTLPQRPTEKAQYII